MRKIAHISINYNPDLSSGILSNAKSKLVALNKLGINNFDFFLINDFIESKDGGVRLVKLNHKNYFSQYYNKIFNKYKLIKQVINLDEYDKIVIRYPFADKSLIDMVKQHKIFFELHSIINEDLKTYFKTSYPNKILMIINGVLRIALEKIFSKSTYDNSLGFISVTNEISLAESKKSKNKNFISIGNGIDTDKFKPLAFKKFDGKTLNLIMICSMDSYWHGIERLIESIDNFNSDIEFKLHLVGHFSDSKYRFKNNKNRIIYSGILDNNEVSKLIPEMNLAIGTLGLHKKFMYEASVLKVREYVSRGIPFIKAYIDTDIDSITELSQYFIDFPNDDSLIDINKIIDFLKSLSKSELDISEEMHDIAVKELDWTVKMKEYVNFINQ